VAAARAAEATEATAGGGSATDEGRAVLESRLAEMEDRWRRAVAELDNQRKRAARDADLRRDEERGRAASQWLPVLDNLDLALQHAEADPDSIISGVRAVRDQAIAVLSGLGYPRREDDAGVPFDPARHEAVAAVPDEAREGQVLQVVRPGYGEGDHQLRPASVVVATRSP
ncbi:MAG: nucleotide exchange factor GrpE, partial [Mycobacterium sp.]|nr:nucleotide exchange factor GrpE [Mycobacterium sp.]